MYTCCLVNTRMPIIPVPNYDIVCVLHNFPWYASLLRVEARTYLDQYGGTVMMMPGLGRLYR
jgi:hypothetical protein